MGCSDDYYRRLWRHGTGNACRQGHSGCSDAGRYRFFQRYDGQPGLVFNQGKDSDRKSTEQLVKEIEGLRKELSEMRANTGR